MPYRVWVRAWVAREEVFEDRHSAELFRLKLAASRPSLNPSDVAVVPDRSSVQGGSPVGGLGVSPNNPLTSADR